MPTRHQQPTLRFAPSPTGELHIGHAVSALINQQIARHLNGRVLLRIEDIDIGRRRQSFVDGIYRDLEWIGFEWDGPVLMQSERFDIYRHYLWQLDEQGLLYRCFATRKEIAAAAATQNFGTDPEGAPIYPQLHKGLSASQVKHRTEAGEAYAQRLDMTKALELVQTRLGHSQLTYRSFDAAGNLQQCAAEPARWGDVVLGRKDSGTSYHMACTIDDALQGVTHIVRGQDLEAATDIHRLLQTMLELSEPVYHHHALFLDTDGRKLSKSFGDVSLRQLREAGMTPEKIKARVRDILERYCEFKAP